MSYERLLSRLKALEPGRVDLGPWPPESGIGKILYDELIEKGIEVSEPPAGESPLICLLKLGAKDAFKDEL